MSKRLIQDLHAGISRHDWAAVEVAANRLRDDIEKTVATLAGTGIASLPNDYPLSRLAIDALNSERERCAQIAEGRSKSFDYQKALASHDDMAYGANTTRTEIALAIREGCPPPMKNVVGWQPIETAPKNVKVLAAYQNELGNWRIVTACYHTQLDWSDEYGDHEDEGEFAPEAWYEENDSSDVIYPTSRKPTHWIPLPAPPAIASTEGAEG